MFSFTYGVSECHVCRCTCSVPDEVWECVMCEHVSCENMSRVLMHPFCALWSVRTCHVCWCTRSVPDEVWERVMCVDAPVLCLLKCENVSCVLMHPFCAWWSVRKCHVCWCTHSVPDEVWESVMGVDAPVLCLMKCENVSWVLMHPFCAWWVFCCGCRGRRSCVCLLRRVILPSRGRCHIKVPTVLPRQAVSCWCGNLYPCALVDWFFFWCIYVIIIIIVMEISEVPTQRLKVLNKHNVTRMMYITSR